MSEAKGVQTQWRFAAAVAFIAILAAIRVSTTHRVFSEVLDEPAHLSSGFAWFDGTFDIDASHPPLARVLAALPLRLSGFPAPARTEMVTMGNELLYHGGRYEANLARSRIGNLVLLMAAILATAYWARRVFSPAVGIAAAALLSGVPAVLGHAGVATTDLAALTAMAIALLALDVYLAQPDIRHGILLGAAIGIGVLAKFSFLVYFPACAVVAILMRWPVRVGARSVLVVALSSLFVLWAGYRFDFRTAHAFAGDAGTAGLQVLAPSPLDPLAARIATSVPIPAPAFWTGIGFLRMHDKEGHGAFFLGEVSWRGWWHYFPVVFFYKTPLPYLFLALWGAGLAVLGRNRRQIGVFLMALAVLGVAMTSSINIGVRHILPIYAPLSIVAAHALVSIWRQSRDAFGRTAIVALAAWFFIGVAVSHPDYLAWFNEAAQPNPAAIAVDSNLDWGQDSLRLARTLREMQIPELHVDILTNVRLEEHGIRRIPFNPSVKASGWLAVSETMLAMKAHWGEYQWLRAYRPVRRVGRSIRLYDIP